MSLDCLIVGGGLVGLATAHQILLKNPRLKVAVFEKETRPAFHQSGRNSGVVHSGIYYKPGSLKAKNCLEGRKELLKFCERKVEVKNIHKVILAKTSREEEYLQELLKRGHANGVKGAEIVSQEKLKEIEPHASALKALHVPFCQIVDYAKVALKLSEEIQEKGGFLIFGEEIESFEDQVAISCKGSYPYKILINCAGLQSDRIAKKCLGSSPHQILPFRGEYYLLKEEKRHLVKGLIYPVPNPKFPFLGVHLTPMVNGHVEAGPNAILALAREGYQKKDIKFKDLTEVLTYSGFWKMAFRYWKAGAYEMVRSFSKKVFVRDVQSLVPIIKEEDLVRGGAGIRAQVVKKDGRLMDDFCIEEDLNSIHVINAPSPAATSCFSIGKSIAEKALGKLS